MATGQKIFPDLYRDSVALMHLSSVLSDNPGVVQASLVMATPANLELLREAGLLDKDVEAGPNDLLVAIEARTRGEIDQAFELAEERLNPNPGFGAPQNGAAKIEPHSIEMALAELPQAGLAFISCPGEYAAAEAEKALRLGLDVMVFSDNVTLADEVRLKKYAAKHDLLVMGPDCGTAIIGGVPLGFANIVRRGDIGVVGASGTGTQQVTCLVDRFGLGISHAIGTGGRDLKAEVGGITMTAGLDALARDDETKVIVLISKPPSRDVAAAIIAAAGACKKPVVVNFLGAGKAVEMPPNVFPALSLEDAALKAVDLSRGVGATTSTAQDVEIDQAVEAGRLGAGQRYVRGLFSGGTFCYEAQVLLADIAGPVYSNTPLKPDLALDDVWTSRENTVVDLGDDLFTRGRPHPMIDHRLRNERILREAEDPETAVILLDIVLGLGAHDDPADAMAPALKKAREVAEKNHRHLILIGSVCGTDADPQGLERQEAALRKAGMILAQSNAQAVRLVAGILAQAGGAKNEENAS